MELSREWGPWRAGCKGLPTRLQPASASDESILVWVGRRDTVPSPDQNIGGGVMFGDGSPLAVSSTSDETSGEGISAGQPGSGVDSSDRIISASDDDNSCPINGSGIGNSEGFKRPDPPSSKGIARPRSFPGFTIFISFWSISLWIFSSEASVTNNPGAFSFVWLRS